MISTHCELDSFCGWFGGWGCWCSDLLDKCLFMNNCYCLGFGLFSLLFHKKIHFYQVYHVCKICFQLLGNLVLFINCIVWIDEWLCLFVTGPNRTILFITRLDFSYLFHSNWLTLFQFYLDCLIVCFGNGSFVIRLQPFILILFGF
jgi:hypothetical protein